MGRPRGKITGKPLPLDPERVIEVLREERGLLDNAAEKLGTTRTALRKFISNRPRVVEALKETRDQFVDLAEQKLYELVQAGDYRAITFVLSTLGANRGFKLQPGVALGDSVTTNILVDTIKVISVPPGRYLDAAGKFMPPQPDPARPPVLRIVTDEPKDPIVN